METKKFREETRILYVGAGKDAAYSATRFALGEMAHEVIVVNNLPRVEEPFPTRPIDFHNYHERLRDVHFKPNNRRERRKKFKKKKL